MGIAVLDLAEKRMAWADQRQKILAQNVANANTPHWQARDLTPFSAALAKAQESGMALTRAGHLAGAGQGGMGTATVQPTSERAPDGNAVALDDQLTKIADTEVAQDLAANLYKKYIGMFRVALGRGQ